MDSTNAYIYDHGLTPPPSRSTCPPAAVTYLRRRLSRLGPRDREAAQAHSPAPPTTTPGETQKPPAGSPPPPPSATPAAYTDPTGLLYLINRYYDPATGQFISVDPSLAQTNAPYAYANGNPVSIVDPFGELRWVMHFQTYEINGESHNEWVGMAALWTRRQTRGIASAGEWVYAAVRVLINAGCVFGKIHPGHVTFGYLRWTNGGRLT